VETNEGIKLLLGHAAQRFPSLSHLWLDGAYRGRGQKGKGWVEKVLGWTVELVERPRKLAPEKVLEAWAAEWAKMEGKKVDWHKLLPPCGFQVLPRRIGWWNALWPGSATTAGWRKTTRGSVERRSVRVRCDEPPYGKAVGSHLRPFHTVSLGTWVNRGKRRTEARYYAPVLP
jgi:hypothetical protein